MCLQNEISSSVVEKIERKTYVLISLVYAIGKYIIHMKIFLHLIILLWVHFIIIIIILKQKSMEQIFYFEFYR